MSRTSSPSRKNEIAYLRRVLADTGAAPTNPLALLKGAADGLAMLKGTYRQLFPSTILNPSPAFIHPEA